jgi:hypothetical protein
MSAADDAPPAANVRKEREPGAAQRADCRDLGCAEALRNSEFLQAAHGFDALLQNNRKGALAVFLMK